LESFAFTMIISRFLPLITLASVFIYRILVDLSFLYYVIPFSSYERFTLQPNEFKIIESYIILIALSLLLPHVTKRISALIIYVFFALIIVPFNSYYGLGDQSRYAFYLGNLFWFAVIVLNNKMRDLPVLSILQKKFTNITLLTISFFSLLTVTVLWIFFGASLNLDFSVVYEIRKNYVSQNIPFTGYLVNWCAKVFLPFLALYSLFYFRKKILLIPLAFAFLIEVYLFSVTGNKAYIFSLVLALFFAWFISNKNYFFQFNIIFSALCIVCLLSFLLMDDIWLSSFFSRRMLFIPAKLSYCYFDFFQDKSVYLSHSIFSYFFSYPFSLEPPYLIGQTYFDKPDMSANNGIMADGYMNFGIAGLLIWATIFVLLLKLADSVSYGKNIKIFGAFFIIAFTNFIDGYLLTSLLTHGILIAYIVAFFYPPSLHTEVVDNKQNNI